MRLLLLLLFSLFLVPLSFAVDVDELSYTDKVNVTRQKKETSWWEKREKRSDIYYPHNLHIKAIEKGGDPCLLCHPFNANSITDLKQLKSLNVIANEPLKAICHECHTVKLSAPWRCNLCHNERTSIWPDDHNFDYLRHHSEDARLDDGKCRQCHIDLSFCTDCHLRRDPAQRRVHALGYRNSHGIDARLQAAKCGGCHNSRYCSDCHRETRW